MADTKTPMENANISAKLDELTPTTEYAEFLKCWDAIAASRDRKIRLKAIHQLLKAENVLTCSYVTFTRFVKKKDAEDGAQVAQRAKAEPPQAPAVHRHAAARMEEKAAENVAAEPIADKSEMVATTAAAALSDTIKENSGKDYSKTLRRNRS